MKKTLIKNIGSLITVSSNSELKKGHKMKDLPLIKNAWLKIKDMLLREWILPKDQRVQSLERIVDHKPMHKNSF